MVFKCSVVGYFSNYEGYGRGAMFSLPEKKTEEAME